MSQAKQMCLEVLQRLLVRKGLDGVRKAAKALGISQAKAKDLLNDGAGHTQDEIIKFTAALIQYRQEG